MLLDEIYVVIKEWLYHIKDALSTERQTISLKTINGPVRDDTYPDARQSALADSVIKTMPLPLQTLLSALSDLKQDIVRDSCQQRANYEARVEACADAAVSATLSALQKCTSEKRDAIQKGEIASLDHALQTEVHAFIGPVHVSEWVPRLTEELRKESVVSSKRVVKDNEKEPMIRMSQTFGSCERALKAVEDSKSTRKRLEALAQGPLSSLFEHPLKVETNLPPETITTGHVQSVPKENESGRHSNIKSLLRRTERTRRSILQLQHTLIDDAINQAEQTIQYVLDSLSMPVYAYELPADMKIADSKIQGEIKFVIQTITTDRSSLDQVLRNIKTGCEAIQKENSAECTAHWIILMAKWRLQLIQAYTATQQ